MRARDRHVGSGASGSHERPGIVMDQDSTDQASAQNGVGSEEFAPRTLVGLVEAPPWLRDLGRSAWLAVGVTLFVIGVVWILSLTETIVAPLITAGVVAAVASPLVRRLQRAGVKRGIAAALLLVLAVLLGVAVVVVVLAGIRSQFDGLGSALSAAKDTLANWLTDLGVDRDTAEAAKDNASS